MREILNYWCLRCTACRYGKSVTKPRRIASAATISLPTAPPTRSRRRRQQRCSKQARDPQNENIASLNSSMSGRLRALRLVVRRRSSIARPSHRSCVVSQRLCVGRTLPSQLRRRPKTTASDWCSWRDRIVPFRMESITLDIEGPHFRVADLDALWIVAPIKLAPYCQTCPGRGRGYQFDHCFAAGQRLAAPSLGDVAEQAVFDPVPLRGPWWIMADL